jgi:hypothetical protein
MSAPAITPELLTKTLPSRREASSYAPRLYFADLRHEQHDDTPRYMPLGISYVRAVVEERFPGCLARSFVSPSNLEEALNCARPDILFLSNYVWNERLSWAYAALARRLSPKTLIVMGGPNLPRDELEQLQYLEATAGVDFYVIGDGELVAREIVERFGELGNDRRAMLDEHIAGTLVRDGGGMARLCGGTQRVLELEELPSPWLTGTMDEFFDGSMIPVIETHRGCPFSCSYCVEGAQEYDETVGFELGQVRAELDYIRRLTQQRCPEQDRLCFVDPNFGSCNRDEELCEFVAELQREHGWPRVIEANAAKEVTARISEVPSALGSWQMRHTVQSFNGEVLQHVHRPRVGGEVHPGIAAQLRIYGTDPIAQTVLGLPGERLCSHIATIQHLVDAGAQQIHNEQMVLVQGSQLQVKELRESLGLQTRFRLAPYGSSIVDGERVHEVEEIVISSRELPFPDYVEARRFHLACELFWTSGSFGPAFRCVRHAARSAWQLLHAIAIGIRASSQGLQALFASFEEETRLEFFDSAQNCVDYYGHPGFRGKVERGEIGRDLIKRYASIARARLADELCLAVVDAIRTLSIPELRSESGHVFLQELAQYLQSQLQAGESDGARSLLQPQYAGLRFDLHQWKLDGCPIDFLRYRRRQHKARTGTKKPVRLPEPIPGPQHEPI